MHTGTGLWDSTIMNSSDRNNENVVDLVILTLEKFDTMIDENKCTITKMYWVHLNLGMKLSWFDWNRRKYC